MQFVLTICCVDSFMSTSQWQADGKHVESVAGRNRDFSSESVDGFLYERESESRTFFCPRTVGSVERLEYDIFFTFQRFAFVCYAE